MAQRSAVRQRWYVALGLLALIAGLGIFTGISHTSAASVTPTVVTGNPDCSSDPPNLGLLEAIKVEPVQNGTFAFTAIDVLHSITMSNTTSTSFNWSSSLSIDAVIVKAGNFANIYAYDEAFGDSNLVAPSGFGISHVEFCYDLDPPPSLLVEIVERNQGSGRVASLDLFKTIQCPDVCEAEYLAGTVVVLAALPDAGSAFVEWAGDCTSSTVAPFPRCTVEIGGNRTIQAVFEGLGQGAGGPGDSGEDPAPDRQPVIIPPIFPPEDRPGGIPVPPVIPGPQF